MGPDGNWLGGRMRRLARLTRTACRDLLIPERDITFRNREGIAAYDFTLAARRRAPGVSAMLRARNESTKIITCLASILGMFDEIVFIDNASSDDTLDRVVQFKNDHDARDIIRITQYPHVIARCGDEHWSTPEDSVHSLVYYYNWCLSRCRCAYVFKWDADMALMANATSQMRELFSTLRDDDQALWLFHVQTAYRDTHGSWYRAQGEINAEARLAPNRPSVRYHKARHWEELRSDRPLPRRQFEPVCVYELKDVAEDEFSHWSTTNFPTERKRREWHYFGLVKSGQIFAPFFEPLRGRFIESLEPEPAAKSRP
jgi:hypothetical protein